MRFYNFCNFVMTGYIGNFPVIAIFLHTTLPRKGHHWSWCGRITLLGSMATFAGSQEQRGKFLQKCESDAAMEKWTCENRSKDLRGEK